MAHRKYKILLARFPGGNREVPDCTDWLIDFTLACKEHPLVESLDRFRRNDTPITMSRNQALAVARDAGHDLVVMVDSDMAPDLTGKFWPEALEFIDKRYEKGPTIIGVPYCGPPPHENIYVFRWKNYQSDTPDNHYDLQQYSRDEAAGERGIGPVAALPTGLAVIDMRLITGMEAPNGTLLKMPRPWFDYEYKDDGPPCPHCGQRQSGDRADKASTEDVYFTRNASILFEGVGQFPPVNYCAWDAWAAHWKEKAVGKPASISTRDVSQWMRDAVAEERGKFLKVNLRKEPMTIEQMQQRFGVVNPLPLPSTNGHEEKPAIDDDDWEILEVRPPAPLKHR